MVRFVLAGLAAAVALHIWGMVWWMALPFADQAMNPLPDTQVADTLAGATQESGAYYFPAPPNGDIEDPAYVERHQAGPIGLLFIRKEGGAPMDGGTIAKGFAHYFAVALMLAGVLLLSLSPTATFSRRVAIVTLAGISGVVFSNLAFPIWWHHPPAYWIMTTIYEVLACFIAALVLAALIKPKVLTAG